MRTVLLTLALLASSTAFAAAKSYQVTGPVLEIRDDVIVVQKGKEKWEINKGTAKIDGELKVGAKVTISYSMTADGVDVKADAAKK